MKGRIAVGEMLGLHRKSQRGFVVILLDSPTPLPYREEGLMGSVLLKCLFPHPLLCEGSSGLLALHRAAVF